ncbi:hypothetical protein WMF18_42475 [Sorangium sp. So ce315]|uniref:hypothetical protein n=1 Tax=Sorangium sp. So ce315 TaxID=3133299 RepID=UPI003F5DB34A
MTRMKLLGLVMAGLALVACGDDEVGDGDATGSELDGKQLGALTAEEAEEVCRDAGGQARALSKEDKCELAGVGATIFGMECETAKQECISAPEEPEEPEELGSCDALGFAGCTATVAELKACTTAIVDTVAALTCESTIADFLQKPAACAALEEKCPGFFEDEEEETESEDP